jgi:hypothetical protein
MASSGSSKGGGRAAPSRGRAGKQKIETAPQVEEEDEDQPICAVCLEPDGQ